MISTQVCSQCLYTSRHASATRCQTETIGGCENEKKYHKSEKVDARKPYVYICLKKQCISNYHYNIILSKELENHNHSLTLLIEGSSVFLYYN